MTIFRCDQLRTADVQLVFTSSNEPDTIGVEFQFEGNGLFEIIMDGSGTANVLFDEIENAEIPISDLRALLDRGEKELIEWHARLSETGQMWAKE